MHKEILNKKQIELLPLIHNFNKGFGLVGGTAIALQIGHRESIDLDLFSCNDINNAKIIKIIKDYFENNVDLQIIRDEIGEYTLFINKVKCTFFYYPFKIQFDVDFDNIIKMPNLITLAAMKAYTLGRRVKWKDYVDLYFIFNRYSLQDVVEKSKEIFGNEFSEKNFREQLSYFEDIDYTEKIIFKENFKVSDEEIKRKLQKISIS